MKKLHLLILGLVLGFGSVQAMDLSGLIGDADSVCSSDGEEVDIKALVPVKQVTALVALFQEKETDFKQEQVDAEKAIDKGEKTVQALLEATGRAYRAKAAERKRERAGWKKTLKELEAQKVAIARMQTETFGDDF